VSAVWLAGGLRVDPWAGTAATGDVFLRDGVFVDRPADTAGFDRIDCAGRWVLPGFVDLHADLVDPVEDGRAALHGGFTTVVQTGTPSLDNPVAVRDFLARARADGPEVLVTPAATVRLEGGALADLGTFAELGAAGVSCGASLVGDTRVLKAIFAYAASFDLPVFLRAGDPYLDVGLCREGPRSAWLGLPGTPPASEVIGIHRVGALARATGATVHVTHVWSAAGVEAVRAERAAGSKLTASATVLHLALGDERIESSGYAGWNKMIPPLGDAADRAALALGLADGALRGAATDHRPLPPVAQEVELTRAESGWTGFRTAFPRALAALGDPLSIASALSSGPSSILGRRAGMRPGDSADVLVADPAVDLEIGEGLGSQANSPLRGEVWRGAVRCVWRAGRLLAASAPLR
jgi:dihydroorotase